MRIFIDARLYGAEHTGIGRYTENVLKYLPKYLKGQDIKITVLVHPSHKNEKFGKDWQVITTSIRPYSFLEQITVPHLVRITKSDLYFGFHFNVPVFLTTPFITVIHDLIKTYFVGPDTTTHWEWFYQLKRWGYEWSMRHAVTKAMRLIVPSNTVKNQILSRYNLEPSLINVIPEAPDLAFSIHKSKIINPKSNLNLPPRYLLYVGNAYPHKNLSVLLKAFDQFASDNLKLVIVAKPNRFLDKELNKSQSLDKITILSDLTDQELVIAYQKARALITPSLMEGYGLVGLEALMVGTPVIASNIPVYREVYGDQVVYFDPLSVKDLVLAIKSVGTRSSRPLVFKRTWSDVAQNIAEVVRR